MMAAFPCRAQIPIQFGCREQRDFSSLKWVCLCRRSLLPALQCNIYSYSYRGSTQQLKAAGARVVNEGKLVEKYIRGAQSREIICSLPWSLSEFFFSFAPRLSHLARTLSERHCFNYFYAPLHARLPD